MGEEEVCPQGEEEDCLQGEEDLREVKLEEKRTVDTITDFLWRYGMD